MAGNCEFPKYFLSDSKSQCIDGTRAVYYLRAGTGTGISKWHIHFEGGGWCYDLESCHYRSTTKFGSSKEYEECFSYKFNNSAYFSSNETENPLLHNYNMVYVRYCDGGSFAGNDMQRYQSKPLYFSGKRIRQNLLSDLWNLRGMKKATDLIFSGASAGGLAVYLGIDEIRNYVKRNLKRTIRIVGMPDSGFFLNYDSSHVSKGMKKIKLHVGGPRYQHLNGRWFADEYDPQRSRNIFGSKMKKVFNFTGIGKPLEGSSDSSTSPLSRCQSLLSDPRECIFPQNLLSHISVPLFILQPLYDSWMITHVLGVPLQEDDTLAITQFGQMVKDSLFNSIPLPSPHGIYLDSCHHHTFASSIGSSVYPHIWDSKHVTIPQALMNWYQQMNSSALHIQEGSFPCSHCCGTAQSAQHLPVSSPPSDSLSPIRLTIFISLLLSIVLIFLLRLRKQQRI